MNILGDVARGIPGAAGYVVRAVDSARRGPESLTPGTYQVAIFDDDASFYRLADEWRALHTRAHARSPFTTFAWVAEWWRHVARRSSQTLHVVTVRAGAELVGAGAFYIEQASQLGPRLLRFAGDTAVGTEYLDVTVDPAHVSSVISILLQHFATTPLIDGIFLRDAVDESPLITALGGAVPGLIAANVEHTERMPYVDLRGGFEAYSKSVSANMRSNMKRKQKRLFEAYPEAKLCVIDEPDDLSRALETLFRLHALRWGTRGQTGNFVREGVIEFHRAVAPRLLEQGILRLYEVRLDAKKVAASLYCLRDENREHYLQAGFDPAFEHVSIGFCMMRMVIERCANEGVQEFEMLRGTEAYKNHWTHLFHRTRSVRSARGTARGLAWVSSERLQAELKLIVRHRLSQETIDDGLEWLGTLGQGPPPATRAVSAAGEKTVASGGE